MDGDQLSHLLRSRRTGIRSRLYGAHVSPDHHGDQAAAHLLLAHQLDIGRLYHGIRRFDGPHQAFGFNHSKRIGIHNVISFPC